MFGGRGESGATAAAIIGGLLLAAAAVLLAVGLFTPASTDAAAYDAALQQLTQDYHSGRFGQGAATEFFYDIQDRFGTRHWLYLDLAGTALACGVAALGVALARMSGLRLTTREPAIVLPAVVVAIGLFFLGLAAGPFLLFQRGQLPTWSDTIGIPIFTATVVTVMLAPLLALLALPPLYFGRRPRGLFRSARGRVATVLVTAFYLLPLAGAVFLLSGAVEPGGWLLTLGAGLMIWLLLNARAHWLGVRSEAPLP